MFTSAPYSLFSRVSLFCSLLAFNLVGTDLPDALGSQTEGTKEVAHE